MPQQQTLITADILTCQSSAVIFYIMGQLAIVSVIMYTCASPVKLSTLKMVHSVQNVLIYHLDIRITLGQALPDTMTITLAQLLHVLVTFDKYNTNKNIHFK